MSFKYHPQRIQYNVFLRKNSRIDILSKVKDSLLPVMWIEEFGEVRTLEMTGSCAIFPEDIGFKVNYS